MANVYEVGTKIFLLVASWLPTEKVNFEPCSLSAYTDYLAFVLSMHVIVKL